MSIKKRINDNAINCYNYAITAALSAITAIMATSLQNNPVAIISYAVIIFSFIVMFVSFANNRSDTNNNSGCRTITQCNLGPISDNKSLTALLGITGDELKQLRDCGVLGYSRHGDKYWYTQSDIDRFLARCHYAPFAESRD